MEIERPELLEREGGVKEALLFFLLNEISIIALFSPLEYLISLERKMLSYPSVLISIGISIGIWYPPPIY